MKGSLRVRQSRTWRSGTHCVVVGAVWLLGCRSERPSASPELAAAPVAPPALGVSGCVESDELHAYVSALDANRRLERDAALAARGARLERRRGVFLDSESGAKLDGVLEAGGRRYAVVAQQAVGFEPVIAIARRGNELHRIDERARAHGVPVTACGVTPCPRQRSHAGQPPAVRAVGIELAPEETLGAPLALSYDYWWAQVRYPKHARCGAPQVTLR